MSEADLFWDENDPETGVYDICDIMDNYCEGEIVRIQRAVRLHDVFAVRAADGTNREFDSLKEAEEWFDSQKGEG